MRFQFKILLVLGLLNSIFAEVFTPKLTDSSEIFGNKSEILRRKKRFLPLTFPGGGVAKYVAGYLGPIDTPLFINCNAIRNFQFQFPLPTNWVTNPPTWPGLNARSLQNDEPKYQSDSSRKIAYEVIEDVLDREGKNGRHCLLRAICEVAESPVNHVENGIIGEIVQVFFTPGQHEIIDVAYRDAASAGRNHIDCSKLYSNCPMGHGILDSISLIREYGLTSWFKF